MKLREYADFIIDLLFLFVFTVTESFSKKCPLLFSLISSEKVIRFAQEFQYL